MANSPQEIAKPLKIKEKLAYGFGDVAFGLAVSSVGFWLMIYLTDVAGLGAFLAGIAVMVGRAWDAVTDPVMGWVTDNTRSRWGKRRPYLLFGAIPYALAFFSLWVIPDFESQSSIFWYVTIALIVFNTALTVVFVPYTSLTAAITDDYDERTAITGYRMFCSQTAFLIGAAIPSFLVLYVTTDAGKAYLDSLGLNSLFGSWAGTERQGYFMMATIFAVIMTMAIWVTFAGCRERFVAENKSTNSNRNPFGYLLAVLSQLKESRPFRLSVGIMLFTSCAATLIAVMFPYFIQYSLMLKTHQTKIITLLFAVAIVMVPVWVLLTKKLGKAESYQLGMSLYAGLLCYLPFAKQGDPTTAYILAACAGVCHSAALMIPWAIIPDVVEYDELQNNERREGLFYGGTTFSYKLATALAVFISGIFLETIGYVPNVPQAAETVDGINILIGPVPACILLIGIIMSVRYPITSKMHKEILAKIAAKA